LLCSNHELKNNMLAIGELCFSNDDTTDEIDMAKIGSMITEGIELLVTRGILTDLASGTSTAPRGKH